MFPDDPATRDCRALLSLIGIAALSGGVPGIAVGLFVGPHVLFAAFALLGVAAVGGGLAWGLDRTSTVARWGTRAVGVLLSGSGACGLISTLPDELGAAGVNLYVLVVGGTLAVRAMRLPVRAG